MSIKKLAKKAVEIETAAIRGRALHREVEDLLEQIEQTADDQGPLAGLSADERGEAIAREEARVGEYLDILREIDLKVTEDGVTFLDDDNEKAARKSIGAEQGVAGD